MDLNVPAEAGAFAQVQLKRDVFPRLVARRGEAQTVGDPGVPPVGPDQQARAEAFPGRIFLEPPGRAGALETGQPGALLDRDALFDRQTEEQIVQQAALEAEAKYAPAVVPGKRHDRFGRGGGQEERADLLVLQGSDRVADAEPVEEAPAGGIQKIAAQLGAREHGLVQQRDRVAPAREEHRGGRARRAGADDRDVKRLHGANGCGRSCETGRAPGRAPARRRPSERAFATLRR